MSGIIASTARTKVRMRARAGLVGPTNKLALGTVTTGAAGTDAAVTIGGIAPAQTISFVLPRGAVGPANVLQPGTTTTGAAGSAAAVSITGTAPNQTLNLTIPRGDQGIQGAPGVVQSVNGKSTAVVVLDGVDIQTTVAGIVNTVPGHLTSTRPGSGAVARPLVRVLMDRPPTPFDYLATGVTDHTSAIQATLDNYGACFLPPGTNWSVSQITLGVGKPSTITGIPGYSIVTPQGALDTFVFKGPGCSVSDLKIDESGKSAGYTFCIDTRGLGNLERTSVRRITSYSSRGLIHDLGTAASDFHTSTTVEDVQMKVASGPGINLLRAFAFILIQRVAIDFAGSTNPNVIAVVMDGSANSSIAAAGGWVLQDIDVSGSCGIGSTTTAQQGYKISNTASAWLNRCDADSLGGRGFEFNTISQLDMRCLRAALCNLQQFSFTSIVGSSGDGIRAFGRRGLSGATANVNGIDIVSGNNQLNLDRVFCVDNTGHGLAKLAAQVGAIRVGGIMSMTNLGSGIYSRGNSGFLVVGGSLNGNGAFNYDCNGAYDYLRSIQLTSGSVVDVGPSAAAG